MSRENRRAKIRRAWHFVSEDIWDIELSSLSSLHSLGVKALRIINLVVKGFHEDNCPLHASALTFNTLMAIVPVLALSLALARAFGGDDFARAKLKGAISEWTNRFESVERLDDAVGGTDDMAVRNTSVRAPTVLADQIHNAVDQAFDRVENISFAALGGVGLALLLWMVISVLDRVESSFNRVWGVAVKRSVWRQFTDYMSAVLILPFLMMAASSLPVADFATRFMDDSTASVFRAFLRSGFLKQVTTIAMTSLCFSFLIMFMPNTKVKFRAGLTGGLVAGILFIIWMWICAALQFGVARYGKIYGSFAVVPIVLAWVFVSWEIVLFGAEVAFSVQNCTTYKMERGAHQANMEARLLLALSVVAEAARAMMTTDGKPFDVSTYARDRRVSVRFLNDVAEELTQSGLIGELSDKPGQFVLLKAPGTLLVQDVIRNIMRLGVPPQKLGLTGVEPRVEKILADMDLSSEQALNRITIQDLLSDDGANKPKKIS